MTVDCTQIEQLALEGRLDAERQRPDVSQHLYECESCRALFVDDGGVGQVLSLADSGGQEFDVDDLAPRLLETLDTEDATLLGRMRAWPTSTRRVTVMAAGMLVCAGALLFWRRPDFAAYPLERMAFILVAFVAFGLVAAWDSQRSLGVPQAPRLRRALFMLGLGLPFVVALLPQAVTGHQASVSSGHAFRELLVCSSVGLAAALPAVLVWHLTDRQTQAVPTQRLVVAAFGALFGNAVLQIHCPLTNVPHLVTGHAFLGLLLMAVLLPTLADKRS